MRNSRWKEVFKSYIINNYKEYVLVGLLFLIGLFAGVFIVNNCTNTQMDEVSTYINDFINKFKSIENIDNKELILNSIKNNIILALIIWIAGTTVIGIPVVLAMILFRGIILGYTIAAFTFTLGTSKGILFCLSATLLQNILFIPAVLTLGVSSINLYKSIIKDKRKENIKVGIIRHTIISILMTIVLVISAVVENVVSISILKKIIKYF